MEVEGLAAPPPDAPVARRLRGGAAFEFILAAFAACEASAWSETDGRGLAGATWAATSGSETAGSDVYGSGA